MMELVVFPRLPEGEFAFRRQIWVEEGCVGETTPFTALENSTPDSFRFRNNNRKRIAQALKQARSGKKKDIKNKEVEVKR